VYYHKSNTIYYSFKLGIVKVFIKLILSLVKYFVHHKFSVYKKFLT